MIIICAQSQCANNSAVKYLKNFGKIIRIALSNGHLTANPLLNYRHTIKKLDHVHLTEEELLVVTNKKMATERLEQVKDVFLFCCYTELSYIDVKQLKNSNIDL